MGIKLLPREWRTMGGQCIVVWEVPGLDPGELSFFDPSLTFLRRNEKGG